MMINGLNLRDPGVKLIPEPRGENAIIMMHHKKHEVVYVVVANLPADASNRSLR
jgi:hypothetical protein